MAFMSECPLPLTEAAAVVVAHESRVVLPDCLAALASAGVPTIVVDNRSSDGSPEIAAAAGATVLANGKNHGYGRAGNQGVRAAHWAKWCLVLNPDVILAEGCMDELLRAAQRYPDAAILAPRLVEPNGRFFFRSSSLIARASPPTRRQDAGPEGDCCVAFASGACLLVRRDVFLQLGGFDEHIFLFYEDDDLCRRISDAGYSIVHVHDAVAQHARGRSSEPSKIFRSRYHQAWSRAYVCRKYGMSGFDVQGLLRNTLKFLGAAVILNRQLMGRYAGSVAGVVDALRGRSALHHEGLE